MIQPLLTPLLFFFVMCDTNTFLKKQKAYKGNGWWFWEW